MDDSAKIDRLLDQRLRTIQIVNLALMAGVVAFMGIVLLRRAGDNAAAAGGPEPTLAYAATAFAVGALSVWLILPGRIVASSVDRIAAGTWVPATRQTGPLQDFSTDSAKLLAAYQTKSIIAAALLEGPAFFAGVVYMQQRELFALAIVAGALLLMLVTFPTRRRVRAWIETNLARIDGLRQFGAEK